MIWPLILYMYVIIYNINIYSLMHLCKSMLIKYFISAFRPKIPKDCGRTISVPSLATQTTSTSPITVGYKRGAWQGEGGICTLIFKFSKRTAGYNSMIKLVVDNSNDDIFSACLLKIDLLTSKKSKPVKVIKSLFPPT